MTLITTACLLFITVKLEKVVLPMKGKKAPDSFLVKYWHHSVQRMCGSGCFDSCWRVATLLLKIKGNGDRESPSAYRFLNFLVTAEKLLEKLIKLRLAGTVRAGGDFPPNHYGLIASWSTIHATEKVVQVVKLAEVQSHHSRQMVLFVMLDVRNTFNSTRWCQMLKALENAFHMPGYLLQILII